MPGESERGASLPGDFIETPAYRGSLRLCRLIVDLEEKFPDDERPVILSGLKRTSSEIGAFLAAGFARSSAAAAREQWEQARARLMETRHYLLLAKSRWLVDDRDLEAFDALYLEVLREIDLVIEEGGPLRGAARRAAHAAEKGRAKRPRGGGAP